MRGPAAGGDAEMARSLRRGEFAEFFDDLVLQGDEEHRFTAYDGDFLNVAPCIEIDVGSTIFEDVVFAGEQFECDVDRAVGDAGVDLDEIVAGLS